MIKKAAMWFGIITLAAGILGFIPGITTDGMLLGIFKVNMWHNIVHIATGIIALLCMSNSGHAKRFFQIFGVVYALVAILGMFDNSGMLLGLLAYNNADMWLHIVFALLFLYFGFGAKE
ncbi:DUF4383 domain-containing protein [Patescibacteria group bacterium]|nr:DUF4383 domain-containing protein [Patescibacteria group bacterium]